MSEFSKRIEDLNDSHYEIVMTVPTEDMIKMIREAKKEFPNMNDKKYDIGDSWTNEDLKNKYYRILSDKMKWFKKWFGKDE